MRINTTMKLPLLKPICGLLLLLATTPLIYGQVSTTQTVQTTAVQRNIQSIPNGAKLKFKGVVIAREGETFRIRDRNRTDYLVLITDRTSVKTNGGFLRSGKKYPVTDILRGLIVEVEGRGDSQGQLVAEKIRFNESDMRAAITSDTRVTPVEENQQRMAGQMDELYAVAAEARTEAAAANTRINDLDEYDVQENVAVTFRVNSAVLLPEAKQHLDEFAAKVTNAKAYSIEVSGHTDSTGSEAKNFRLSRARADAAERLDGGEPQPHAGAPGAGARAVVAHLEHERAVGERGELGERADREALVRGQLENAGRAPVAPVDAHAHVRLDHHRAALDVEVAPFRADYERHSGHRHPVSPEHAGIWQASSYGDGEQSIRDLVDQRLTGGVGQPTSAIVAESGSSGSVMPRGAVTLAKNSANPSRSTRPRQAASDAAAMRSAAGRKRASASLRTASDPSVEAPRTALATCSRWRWPMAGLP